MDKQQSKGGRPPLGTQKRKNKVTAAFTDSEFSHLKEKAAIANVPLSYLVSELATKGSITPRYTEADKHFELSLRRFSNNLNSIAKNMYYFKKEFKQNGVDKELAKLENLLKEIDLKLK